MDSRNTRLAMLADTILEIELEMRQLSLWTPEGSTKTPSPEALMSTQPFCIDTLEFPQWIQFVLLVRVKSLIEAGADLSARSDIAPMAEEYFRPLPQPTGNLVETIRRMDRLISQSAG